MQKGPSLNNSQYFLALFYFILKNLKYFIKLFYPVQYSARKP